MWTPVTGEVLLLTREPENVRDKYAVFVIYTAGNRPKSELGQWIRDGSPVHLQTLRTSKIRRPCQRSHFKAAE